MKSEDGAKNAYAVVIRLLIVGGRQNHRGFKKELCDSGRQLMAPKDVCAIIPETCELVTLHGKKKSLCRHVRLRILS